ncbi:peptidase U32 family protein [Desulfobulbus alkaliphilus]|uniref:peptidase U32 family protein n=1 Tax=Desulfobulbus alkaliphilus TaxID=869814 RepID=UPI0019664B31|nr:U32 family peptidase [Desulfobulbus alkaliphilus]MBM9536313.1 U32 family peptidase [Desulfobulbus alkaliphilus]
MNPSTIELLAPAKNLACGIAAVNHGADAVYIGGPLFSARAAAANSLTDIERLVAHAHAFRAKVYVALNTLLEDEELDRAVALCHRLYELGADALIIQDVGLLESDLPPFPLHASTQMNNRTVEKVRFLEQVGFAQVVLARELSLTEIRAIRDATTVPLEFFVHGALCVAYSGQCFFSEVVAGRSANRGQCAQFCRHSFDLRDLEGRLVAADRFLLSLQDLDLSGHLAALIDAGIRSFKIEGRLKDENYVKNVTAAYRLALDAILEARTDLAPASSGRCRFDFTPDPSRSFSRGATDYFVTGKSTAVAEIRTPKSIGKCIGRVVAIGPRSFTLSGKEPVHNGDGLCFFNRDQTLVGLRVNRVEKRVIHAREDIAALGLTVGTDIFRNVDVAFNKLLERSSQCSTIALSMTLSDYPGGLQLTLIDEDNIRSTTTMAITREEATRAGSIAPMAQRQLSKSGGTIFSVRDVLVTLPPDLFVSAAALNELRRRAFAVHLAMRLASFPRDIRPFVPTEVPWPGATVDYRDQITNRKALVFYRRHGVKDIDPPRLRSGAVRECALMTSRYCIRRQLRLCGGRHHEGQPSAVPLVLADRTGSYLVRFDCDRCEMTVTRKEKK